MKDIAQKRDYGFRKDAFFVVDISDFDKGKLCIHAFVCDLPVVTVKKNLSNNK